MSTVEEPAARVATNAPPPQMHQQKVFTIALILMVLIVSVTVSIIATRLLGSTKAPSTSQSVTPASRTLPVDLKVEYENPFNKSSNYVNPFTSDENPFDELK